MFVTTASPPAPIASENIEIVLALQIGLDFLLGEVLPASTR
jgi:hypothetical protein